ncbi:single-stranded DNA-binding protein [bacterium (Candidatus Blackallbacteria) CG17_big_fil_post_rev_8_21_14_2_50_48_46]|uniref:Single-stranded DNA-binding protein n=1 Tax=bacterium (Candidatus Blackallbacteria) CG17_big_fil_post_rev_8_21_14_2_50_48_46 TaxID=2014261 RepID=A0A2M7G3Y3_9BACT|nr:MAG: single-stranded DNA-binding protein [bacterium (Candidatus Blackallbacteria) CG18_big_fil_WC_8_21_14_2_50_49_26]PIW16537.1 MAG: single-stranded DNA-binding protein [bacterium (Candidatus Blackallbacteria) CG17_big_fil_post_rev_8_21_14_2_50_48_46]PIW46045.1 MAG: single-stranded DNA-binding protein [bacterium (Candidatus Blackallbacteria) CG13_big_fil_rev_8_21_14_2_50_49_14]
MAANNQIVVIGRAGNNVSDDMRHTQSGTAIAEVRLAVNRTTKDASGNPITDWISCKFWDKQAERLGEFVKKGDLISVTGALRVDNWESPQGEKRQKYYVHGENFQMLESRRAREERTGDFGGGAPAPRREAAPARAAAPSSSHNDFGGDEFVDDDELPPF